MTIPVRQFYYVLLVAVLLHTMTTTAAVVDEWRSFPAIGDITTVVQGGKMLYALAGTTLFAVNTNDYTVATYDKTRLLSDTEVQHIAWCEAAKKLVVVYTNENIDLLSPDDVVENIPDYYSKTMTDDKTVNSVDIYGNDAYLSTAFGIVALNVAKTEITNTYNLGQNVAWVHIADGYIYAECPATGQWRAALSDNLLDPSLWTNTTSTYTAKTTTVDSDLLATAEAYKPNGPQIGYFGYMRLYEGKLYTVPGYGGSVLREAAVQILDGDTWTVVAGTTGYEAAPLYRGLFTIDIDPSNSNRWLVGAVPGLYEYQNGSITRCYYWENSILERAATVPETNVNYTEVPTLCFDDEGRAWLIQGINPTPCILCLTREGTFTRYEHSELLLPDGYAWEKPTGLAFASSGRLWFVNDSWRTPGFACYDPSSDQLTTYTTFVNEDNTVMNVNYVRCWAEDHDGNIWIGTDAGPAYLSAADISSGGTTLQQQKLPRTDDPSLADYLLDGVDVNSIAIDAGNRKWFGTNGKGLYLLSSDNLEQVEHFTASTSPLLSDNIEALLIDNTTGLLYIATDKGLCAYSAAITEAKETLAKDDIYAYPNPVRPDYDGMVTIVGLTYDAQVCITTTSGQLVKKGVSTGGTFAWDLTDTRGRQVASGVYFVLVSTAEGKDTVACKVAVVR